MLFAPAVRKKTPFLPCMSYYIRGHASDIFGITLVYPFVPHQCIVSSLFAEMYDKEKQMKGKVGWSTLINAQRVWGKEKRECIYSIIQNLSFIYKKGLSHSQFFQIF